MISGIIDSVSGFISGVSDVWEYIQNLINAVGSIFNDIDFTILYNWLPSDIAGVITAVIAVLLIMALFGLIRRFLFFIG